MRYSIPIPIASLLVASLIFAACVGKVAEPRPPEVYIDAENLIVGVRQWRINLEETCGIEQSLIRRDIDTLFQRIGQNDWRVLFFLNQVPALEIRTDSGDFKCGIASKAYGPAA